VGRDIPFSPSNGFHFYQQKKVMLYKTTTVEFPSSQLVTLYQRENGVLEIKEDKNDPSPIPVSPPSSLMANPWFKSC